MCGHKSRSKHVLRWTCGEKLKAKGVTRRSEPYMMRVPDESNLVILLQSLLRVDFSEFPVPEGPLRKKASGTAPLPKGVQGHRLRRVL